MVVCLPVPETDVFGGLKAMIMLRWEVLELHPPDHEHRSMSLHNLAFELHAQSMKKAGIADLDEALSLKRKALMLRLQGHPDYVLHR